MRNPSTKSFLGRAVRKEIHSTNATVNTLRLCGRTFDAFDDCRADREWERVHGPMTVQRKIGLALGRFVRSMKREAIYAFVLPLKFLLIVVFNVAWFWFLGWLLFALI